MPPAKIASVHWTSLNAPTSRASTPKPAAQTIPGQTLVAPVSGLYFNRDLSWLNFNERVLTEASDPKVPLLERLRFLSIVSSNLDEFFMVRVAEIAAISRISPHKTFPDGLTARQTLAQIRERVLKQKQRQAIVFKEIVEALSQKGIELRIAFNPESSLDEAIRKKLPNIRYILRKSSEALPPLSGKGIFLFVIFAREYAILEIENREERLIDLSAELGKPIFILLERWLCSHIQEFFPNREVVEVFPFKILRDADLRYRPDDEGTLEEQIVEAVERRSRAKIARLEVDSSSYSEGALFLATSLGLDSAALYRFDLPLDLRTLNNLYHLESSSPLRYPEIKPKLIAPARNVTDLFDLIKKRDILVHHPYDSFDVVVRFIQQAAADPKTTHIFHTLYRTSKVSPIMAALKEAARNSKKVSVYVEIKARFDELNNAHWATELRKAGVRVIQPFGKFKVHSKLTQVLRQEGDKTVTYLHLGTGNYHEATARQYTDLGLLTCDDRLGLDCNSYYKMIAKRSLENHTYKSFLVAPKNLHGKIMSLIREEIRVQKSGGEGHIVAKMNALTDPSIIRILYEASMAGVRIDLLVRGTCCLRPGIPSLSENIKVISIVDRFLEHSRIYYFRAGGEHKIYLSSADWRPRNFYSRYEIAFPIYDSLLKTYLWEVILKNSLNDNMKSSILRADGTYSKVDRLVSLPEIRSQFIFESLAEKDYHGTVLQEKIGVL